VPGARELIDEIVVAHYEALAEDDEASFAIPPGSAREPALEHDTPEPAADREDRAG
jgi:hypothetical protein